MRNLYVNYWTYKSKKSYWN